MQFSVEIPDELARHIMATGGDLSRKALEALAFEELRAGRITEPDLARVLGLGRLQLEGLLKAHGVYQDYSLEDFEAERMALKKIGL